MAPITESAEQPSMILFLGVTGAGKSYMINQLAGQMNAEEGSNLDSCTQTCQLVPAQLGRTRVLLLDTPGFDDPKRDDAEILSEIARVLSIQRESGTELKGVIFIHSITLMRYTGSAIRIFEIVRKICGDPALKNVLLVTSRWSQVNQTDGSKRESQLREKFWAYMLAKGSNMSRFHGDRDSAIALVSQLLCKDNVVLELQTELSDEGKDLDMTVAGSFVRDNLGTLVVRYNEELAALEEAKQGFAQGDGAMERQYQIDWEDTLTRLKRAIDHQASLRRAIGVEVREEVKRSPLLDFLISAVGILAHFVNVPPLYIEIIHSWINRRGSK